VTAESVEEYPCPECLGTMLPGVMFYIGEKRDRGTGTLWSYYSGSANSFVPPPPPTLVACYRCEGTGMVADRREHVAWKLDSVQRANRVLELSPDRRKGGDRRAVDRAAGEGKE